MTDRPRGIVRVTSTRIGRTDLGPGSAIVEDDALVIAVPGSAGERPIRVPFTSVDAVGLERFAMERACCSLLLGRSHFTTICYRAAARCLSSRARSERSGRVEDIALPESLLARTNSDSSRRCSKRANPLAPRPLRPRSSARSTLWPYRPRMVRLWKHSSRSGSPPPGRRVGRSRPN